MANTYPCIKKAYLYDTEAGTVELTYGEWANEHIQDSETAHQIAQRMIADGSGVSENFDESERVFEVYEVKSMIDFVAQMNEYEGERTPNGTCEKCGSPLGSDLYCTDETCPYSDHPQTADWIEG